MANYYGHILDDLKTNFRSWEQDSDNKEDTERLVSILTVRHPDLSTGEIESYAEHWTGYIKDIMREIE